MIKKIIQSLVKQPDFSHPDEENKISISEKFDIQIKKLDINSDGTLLVTLMDGLKIFLRNVPHSDIQVFNQIFADKEYSIITDLYLLNSEFIEDEIKIIDAGANVGYTTIFFLNTLEKCQIISIEPDSDNFSLLSKNIDISEKKDNVVLLNRGLMGKENISLKINTNFRDGKDWALTVTESNENSGLCSVSIPQLIKEYSLEKIDILKIDIEGAERFLFLEENDLDYLKMTKTIIIEIHDEFDCRDVIYKTLKKYNFIIINAGESTLAINKEYL
jgi:FkbM family methyltransferase